MVLPKFRLVISHAPAGCEGMDSGLSNLVAIEGDVHLCTLRHSLLTALKVLLFAGHQITVLLVLYTTMLYYAKLCYATLYYAMLYYTMLHCLTITGQQITKESSKYKLFLFSSVKQSVGNFPFSPISVKAW